MSSEILGFIPAETGTQSSAARAKRRHAQDPEELIRHNQRARDNQQRCRARRKELLNDLQRRVELYERQGVQATQEMQQAARRVAGENARLRALLARKGVSDVEVEEWLRVVDQSPVHSQDILRMSGDAGPHQTIAPVAAPVDFAHSPNEPPTPPASISSYQTAPTPPASMGGYQVTAVPLPTSFVSYEEQQYRIGPPSLKPAGTDFCGPSRSRTGVTQPGSLSQQVAECCTTGTETSCEVAAAILASMHGHGDTGRARAALGCTDATSDCTVKNTRVLELLDEAG